MITLLPAVHCFVRRPSPGRSRITSIRTIEGNTRLSIGSSAGVTFAAPDDDTLDAVCADCSVPENPPSIAAALIALTKNGALQLGRDFMVGNSLSRRRGSGSLTQATLSRCATPAA